jgi:hypothetical protein
VTLSLVKRIRWKVGDFVGRWISKRLGEFIEGETW